jgi:hypothetical protein
MQAVAAPLGVPRVTAAVMTLDSYPAGAGRRHAHQRVADVMPQFLRALIVSVRSMLAS